MPAKILTNNATKAIDQYKLGQLKNLKRNNSKKPSLKSFKLIKRIIFKPNKEPKPLNNLRERKKKNIIKGTGTKNKTYSNNSKKALPQPLESIQLKPVSFIRQKRKIIKTV